MGCILRNQSHLQRYLVDTGQVTENQVDKHSQAGKTQRTCSLRGNQLCRLCSHPDRTSILVCLQCHCMHLVGPLLWHHLRKRIQTRMAQSDY